MQISVLLNLFFFFCFRKCLADSSAQFCSKNYKSKVWNNMYKFWDKSKISDNKTELWEAEFWHTAAYVVYLFVFLPGRNGLSSSSVCHCLSVNPGTSHATLPSNGHSHLMWKYEDFALVRRTRSQNYNSALIHNTHVILLHFNADTCTEFALEMFC